MLGFWLAFALAALAQRSYAPQRLAEAPVIDGRPDGMYGFGGSPADAPNDGFRQFAPDPLAPATQPTEVWIGYDDEALYVAARLWDSSPDSILQQLSERDRLRNTDWFGVSVNPYRDGINAFNFVVTPANVQYDGRFGAGTELRGRGVLSGGDRSWDAVWASAASIDDGGWFAELRIPYSMLRFPGEPVQTWDVNFARQLRRLREESFWNPVDPKGPGPVPQMGQLTGLRDLSPPLRLQATPFVTAGAALSTDPQADPTRATGTSVGGGLDLKYGISDAFTLDMTAIPDFSNARSDDQVLNLGANEIQFDENRAFFTEGVELFNKGDFFYSRRVGGVPFDRGAAAEALREDEVVDENPVRARLLNATKVSGRLANGLGIGVFNAVEGATRATLLDTLTREMRRVRTAPTTNYSVVSLDQNLPHNSFVTLLNTNVLREGSAYDANLTGVVFDLRPASNQWNVEGKAALSQQYGIPRPMPRREGELTTSRLEPTNVFGHTLEVGVNRLTGRLRYGARYGEESDTYDPNDLGFLFFNNSRFARGFAEYNWFEPFGAFNSASAEVFSGVRFLYDPALLGGAFAGGRTRLTTREFFTFGVSGFSGLTRGRELQDARSPGRYYYRPMYWEAGGFISSDYRRAFALDVRGSYGSFHADPRTRVVELSVSPRLRVSDRLSARLRANLSQRTRVIGYVGHAAAAVARQGLDDLDTGWGLLDETVGGYELLDPDGILLSYRNVPTAELELSASYSLNANVTFNLRARHYFSRVTHDEFAEVDLAGELQPTPYTGLDADGEAVHDRTFNAFNVDGFLRWRFAPGSDAFLSYKTQSFFGGDPVGGYFVNLAALGDDRVDHTLTLKMVYWLDVGARFRR